jgi:MFS family permease
MHGEAAIDIPARADRAREAWTGAQALVVALCCLVNMLDGMDTLIVSFVSPSLATQWHVSFQALGVVFSMGLAGMMVGSVVLAPLADFIGRRPMIILGVALLSIGTITSGMVDSTIAFALCRLVIGCGIGALLASVAALVSESAPPARRTVAIGIFQAGYPLGAVFTGFACIWFIPRYGWQATLVGAGITSTIVIPILWWLLPESKRQAPPQSTAHAPATSRLREIFANGMWQSTALLWVATLLAYAVLYFVTSWIPKLATEAGLNASDSLWAGTMFNFGGLFGGLLMGWLAQRRRVGHLIATFFVVSAAAMMLFGAAGSLAEAGVFGVAFLMGLALQGGFTGFYSLGALLYPTEVRSTGIGWAVGIGRAGSIVGPLVGGFLLAQSLPLWIVQLCFAVPLLFAGVVSLVVGRNVRPPAVTP